MADKPKSLTRSELKQVNILRAVEQVKQRNNDTLSGVSIKLFLFAAVSRIHNIRFKDLQIQEFKTTSDRSSSSYALLIISLFLSGLAARSEVLKTIGLSWQPATNKINQMIAAGYVEPVEVKVLKYYNSHPFLKPVEHLQLTSKGYDLASHIAGLLIDPNLL